MSRTRRIAATAVIVASATLGVAGVANASENHNGWDHGGYSHGCQYNNHNDNGYGNRYDNRYDRDRYDNRYDRDRYNDCRRYSRGLVADVLHLVGNIL